MAELRSFAIQRDDARWYAGTMPEDGPRWADDFQEALRFDDVEAANQTLRQLQQSGYAVRLYGLP